PLAKWAMLLTGNYRCVTKDGAIDIKDAVHGDVEASRAVYNFVVDLCVKLGADRNDLVPFEKYAAAAQSLTRPSSAARALNNGVPNIQRADKLVQGIAAQKGLRNPVIDATVALVDARLEANRKKAAAACLARPRSAAIPLGAAGVQRTARGSECPSVNAKALRRATPRARRGETAPAPCPRNLHPTRTSWRGSRDRAPD